MASRGRRRLGVALLLDPPISLEVDGLRRALGDGSLSRIPPHVTLVPPLNVAASDFHGALERLRSAAASVPGPLQLSLGPPRSFLPANPVLYLPVGGDLEELSALRQATFAPPLCRELSWPWVPHVTLLDDAPPERIEAALRALDRYGRVVALDRLVLLEESAKAWRPIADARLGPPAVLGRGGFEVEITEGRLLDPEAAAALGGPSGDRSETRATGRAGAPTAWRRAGAVEEAAAGRDPELPTGEAGRRRIVLTARAGGQVVGAAAAWLEDDGGHVAVLVAPEARGQGVGSHLLRMAEAAVDRAGWNCPDLAACGPAGFYQERSARSRVREQP